MSYLPPDFKLALESDLADRHMTESALGKQIGVSQQSISKWKSRGFPPLYRVKELVAIFGPESRVAKLDLPNMLANTPRIRAIPPNTEYMARSPSLLPPIASVPAAPRTPPAYDSAWEADLAQQLPAELRAYLEAEGPKLGQQQVVMDYNSPKLALMLKRDFRDTGMTARVLMLAAARAGENQHRKRYVIAIMQPSGSTDLALERMLPSVLQESASVLGVEFWLCPDLPHLVARIQTVERDSPLLEDAELLELENLVK